jgi:hypothetical protein
MVAEQTRARGQPKILRAITHSANKFQNSEVIARILGAVDEISEENYAGLAVPYPLYKLLKQFDLTMNVA